MAGRKVVVAINTAWNVFNFRGGLIRAFVDAGYEVVAVAPFDDYAPRLAELGCRYLPLAMDNKGTSAFRDLALLWKFLILLRRERPVAYLGYTVKPNVYGSIAAHVLGIPVINNIAGLGTVFVRGGWLAQIVKALYQLSLRRSRRVFFQNDEDLALFVRERLVRNGQTGLLPGSGVDLQHFQPPPQRLALCEHPSVSVGFLMVARLLWDKGVREYVEAARLVRQQMPNVEFRLLGFLDVQNPTAVDRAALNAWVEEGVITYLGATSDVRPYLAAADCVVLPSYYMEGTPRSLLEAAAMARPIITTDWVGCRNVVDDGVNGMLCRVRDAHDLAEKIILMARLPISQREALGTAGRAKAEREFDERIVIDQYLRELSRITGKLNPNVETVCNE